jgi:hypothetical protein
MEPFPIRSFLERSDAEAAMQVLADAGIRGEIRTEPPPGWRMGGDLPFTVWVDGDDRDRAIAVLRQHDPPPLLCERCRTKSATVHVTTIIEGISTTSNFCAKCAPVVPT